MDIENKLKKQYEKIFTIDDKCEDIMAKIQFDSKKKKEKIGGMFMKKKLVLTLSVCALVLVAGGVTGGILLGNKNHNDNPKEAKSYLTMDVNPSISFVLDEDNKVLSIKGENDEGKMIISGEAYVGKDVNDVIKGVIKLENESGYLVSGNAEITGNKISFSITSDEENIKNALQESITSSVDAICKELNVDQVVEYASSYTRKQIEELAMKCDPTLTEEKASSMTYEQLFAIIQLYHLDVASLYTEELENMYYKAKDYQFSISESEHTKQVISSLGEAYTSLVSSYDALENKVKGYMEQFNQTYYSSFVDSSSEYQKAYETYKEGKKEILELRKQISELDDSNLLSLGLLKGELSVKEALLETYKTALDSAGDVAKSTVDSVNTLVDGVLNQMHELVYSTSESEITSALNSATKDLDTRFNDVKDNFFTSFEKEYKDEIKAANDKVLEYKKSLLEKVNA